MDFFLFFSSEFLSKLNQKKTLDLKVEVNKEKIEKLDEKKEQLEDKHEFFSFMRDENKFQEKREKLRRFAELRQREIELGKMINTRQTKLENLLEMQSKNVTFLNSMIKKTGITQASNFIKSPYSAFRAQEFKDRMRNMKEECEKYFDAIDLTLVLKGKKQIKKLVEELDIDYDAWESVKMERGTSGKEVLFSRFGSGDEQIRTMSGKF